MTNATTTTDIAVMGLLVPLPILAALISAIVSALVSGGIAFFTLRVHRRQQLEASIAKLIDIAIQYPYLEDDTFAASWDTADKTREDVQRYDNYCCYVFNLLETIWRYHHANTKRINAWFYAQELAVRHRSWWRSEIQNRPGYELHKFHRYIDSMIGGK